MRLKYYLRGLGIGIIVTAVIMGMSGSRKESLSDREIRERAAALGMVEQGSSLADFVKSEDGSAAAGQPGGEGKEGRPFPSGTQDSDAVQNSQGAQDGGTAQNPQGAQDGGTAQNSQGAQESGAAQNPQGAQSSGTAQNPQGTSEGDTVQPSSGTPNAGTEPSNGDTSDAPEAYERVILFEVAEGEGSFAICQKLEDAGLITSASEFDTYLYENEYDKKLRHGSYEIPLGAGAEKIAAILTHAQ